MAYRHIWLSIGTLYLYVPKQNGTKKSLFNTKRSGAKVGLLD